MRRAIEWVPAALVAIGIVAAPLAGLVVLQACFGGATPIEPGEGFDQLGHFGAGHLVASDAVRWTTPELAIEHTMKFARAREDLQHPGRCGDGCQRDLAAWLAGAKAGAAAAP